MASNYKAQLAVQYFMAECQSLNQNSSIVFMSSVFQNEEVKKEAKEACDNAIMEIENSLETIKEYMKDVI